MKKPGARTTYYHKLEKAPVTCFCCPSKFAGSQLLDAHLQRCHPRWFEDVLRKIYSQKQLEQVQTNPTDSAREPRKLNVEDTVRDQATSTKKLA